MKKIIVLILVSLMVYNFGCKPGQPESQLIDREVFFGNPEKASVRLSPDGQYISFLAPENGVLNVWIAPVDNPGDAKVITNDTVRGIRSYQWTHKPGHLVYLQDKGGDENWTIFLVDVEDLEITNLTPYDEIPGPDGEPMKLPNGKIMRPRAQIVKLSKEKPNSMVIQLNIRDPRRMDLYRVDLEKAGMSKMADDQGFLQFLLSDEMEILLATRRNNDGSTTVLKYKGENKWEEFFTVPKEDNMTFGLVGTDKEGDDIYMIDSRGRNTAALVSMDLETGETILLAHDEKSDIQGASLHPTEKNIQAYVTNYLRMKWHVIDEAIQPHFDAIRAIGEGDISILSRTLSNEQWIIALSSADKPVKYYLYKTGTKEARYLYSNQPKLEELGLSNMYPLEIPSRDGKTLVSYLTLPDELDQGGQPAHPIPMVLWVHGGPWARNSYGYHPVHQWLANRGYAVLSVNYRGSTGFGKDFINAGIKEWGAKMHDDLIDAVNCCVDKGIAMEEKVAISGGSYGGYATLVGLAFTPEVFACGVDIVGPSNLVTLLSTIPPYWESFYSTFILHIGDPETKEGKDLLEERSPLNYVDSIRKPLLIGQGANDPRVKQSESDQIVDKMQEKEIPVTYVLYPDEGHGFARPENRLSFFAIMEQFLSKTLGGKAQGYEDDFENSSIQVPAGASYLPGLPAALNDSTNVMEE